MILDQYHTVSYLCCDKHHDQRSLTQVVVWLLVPEGETTMAGEAQQQAAGAGDGQNTSSATGRKQTKQRGSGART